MAAPPTVGKFLSKTRAPARPARYRPTMTVAVNGTSASWVACGADDRLRARPT
jgi:hypothetical protein